MSAISSSCSEPAANVLFEQGLEIKQEQRLQEKQQQLREELVTDQKQVNLAEPAKGGQVDYFA